MPAAHRAAPGPARSGVPVLVISVELTYCRRSCAICTLLPLLIPSRRRIFQMISWELSLGCSLWLPLFLLPLLMFFWCIISENIFMAIVLQMLWGRDFPALTLIVWSGKKMPLCSDASQGCCDQRSSLTKYESSPHVPFTSKVLELPGRAVGFFNIISRSL